MDPTEQTAAVVTGWAVAWGLTAIGIPAMPAIIAGLITYAFTSGRYRARWKNRTPGFRPEPGS